MPPNCFLPQNGNCESYVHRTKFFQHTQPIAMDLSRYQPCESGVNIFWPWMWYGHTMMKEDTLCCGMKSWWERIPCLMGEILRRAGERRHVISVMSGTKWAESDRPQRVRTRSLVGSIKKGSVTDWQFFFGFQFIYTTKGSFSTSGLLSAPILLLVRRVLLEMKEKSWASLSFLDSGFS